ncbi:MAG: SDR family NAD(P)-dependent oxidoreductase, partial [bacterium]|nr:SDR family NAD(P)-dependent oxidoreductase [bacterium]
MSAGVLHDRVAIITGASQGLGMAIAEAYVTAGAHLAICARTAGDLARAADALRERAAA